MENILYEPTYMAFLTNDPNAALARYFEKTGVEGKVLIVRPEWYLTEEHPLVVRSPYGMANGIMVTHLIGYSEAKKEEGALKKAPYEVARGMFDSAPGSAFVYEKKPGRPPVVALDCPCPHCGQTIRSFEDLGFWWGWAEGIAPPYWEELRTFVFRRDNYTCQKCKRRLTKGELRCHHINPKEIGGVDGSRNLVTLCGECHVDEHPIFHDEY